MRSANALSSSSRMTGRSAADKVGMDGTSSFGAGRLWFLSDYGLAVTEADRPDRDGATLNLFILCTPYVHPAHIAAWLYLM